MGTFLRGGVRALVEPRPGEPRRLPLGAGRGIRLAGDPSLPLDVWFGLFESELAGFVTGSCAPGRACVDVGSYNGYYALQFAKLGGAPVVAYDQNPLAGERIRRNLDLNPELAGAIEWRQALVGASTEPATGTVALDADLEGWGPVGLLKMDVEGAEHEVLRGARRILGDERPHVIVETHSAELERRCAELLHQHGYRPRVLTQRRRMPQNRPPGHNRWLVASA